MFRSGREPTLSENRTGMEPMLGGIRRAKRDRALFWQLLEIDTVTRTDAIEKVLDQGAAKGYAAAMLAVLHPDARHHKVGHLWKVPFSHYHKLAAMDSLIRLAPDKALSGLVIALRHDDLALQQAAIACMARLDDDTAERALLDILDDPRLPIRHAVIRALADRWSLPALRRLTSPIGAMVAESARWLGDMEGPRVLPALEACLRDTRPGSINHEMGFTALVAGISALARRFPQQCGTRATRILRTLLDENNLNAGVRTDIVDGLRHIGTEEAAAVAIVYETQHSQS